MSTRIAVVGAGAMAHVRSRALLATGRAEICAVASRHTETAARLAREVSCPTWFDDFTRIAETDPQAVLVETPHEDSERIVLWALRHGLPVLVGGPLARSSVVAGEIARLARERQLVVEAGYHARYAADWETTRDLVTSGSLGRIVLVRTVALWGGDSSTWYYDQESSGGMPLTHMSYCFINPLRWIFGDPRMVSAIANRIAHTGSDKIQEESCVATMLFQRDVLCSMTAGFVKPGDLPAWSVTILGSRAAVELFPGENSCGRFVLYGADGANSTETRDFSGAPSPFEVQADTFLDALEGDNRCRNRPEDTLGDIRVAEAVVSAARSLRTVAVAARTD